MKNAGKGGGTKSTRSVADARKDRRSATGMSGSPKKGGHGGKFTWSGDGYSQAEMGLAEKKAVDAHDPNFEEPEETVPVADS
nr:programmed cell death protein 4-like [Ipomoea batatas]